MPGVFKHGNPNNASIDRKTAGADAGGCEDRGTGRPDPILRRFQHHCASAVLEGYLAVGIGVGEYAKLAKERIEAHLRKEIAYELTPLN